MQIVVSSFLEGAGIVCLVVGYRKSNRNLMLLAAVLLWAGGGLNDMVSAFHEGYAAARSLGAP